MQTPYGQPMAAESPYGMEDTAANQGAQDALRRFAELMAQLQGQKEQQQGGGGGGLMSKFGGGGGGGAASGYGGGSY